MYRCLLSVVTRCVGSGVNPRKNLPVRITLQLGYGPFYGYINSIIEVNLANQEETK